MPSTLARRSSSCNDPRPSAGDRRVSIGPGEKAGRLSRNVRSHDSARGRGGSHAVNPHDRSGDERTAGQAIPAFDCRTAAGARGLRAPSAAPAASASPARGRRRQLSAATSSGSPIAMATVANGLGICVRSQLFTSSAAGLEVKRHHRIAGRLRQPHRAGLGDARRPARAVDVNATGFPAAMSRFSCSTPFARRATSIRAPCRSRTAR